MLMQTVSFNFERTAFRADENETVADVLRAMAAFIDEQSTRTRGELTLLEFDPPDLFAGGVVQYRTEDQSELGFLA